MKIKKSVLSLLDNNMGHATIMLALNVSHTTARSYIKNNSDDLTKAAALKAISKFTGLEEGEIMEEDMVSQN